MASFSHRTQSPLMMVTSLTSSESNLRTPPGMLQLCSLCMVSLTQQIAGSCTAPISPQPSNWWTKATMCGLETKEEPSTAWVTQLLTQLKTNSTGSSAGLKWETMMHQHKLITSGSLPVRPRSLILHTLKAPLKCTTSSPSPTILGVINWTCSLLWLQSPELTTPWVTCSNSSQATSN